MRAFVFTDEALAGQAGRFVWLELDNERAKNAPYRKRLGVAALPTYFVLDPRDTTVVMKWVGGLSVARMRRFLEDARLAVARHGEPLGHTPADSALARADRAYGAAQDSAAAAAYAAALATAPESWPPYSRAVESMLFAASRAAEYQDCADAALAALPRLGRTGSAANVAASGLDCASSLPDSLPRRAELLRALLPVARSLVADTTIAMAADDRSGLYISIDGALQALGDSAASSAVAADWSAFLDAQAARARTPSARAVFDSHRLSAYIELGHPERAIPMLEASERDAPEDYNPPARLAIAYRELKRWDEGLAASDRAMARAYGPRKLLIYGVRVDLYAGKGDLEAARRTLEEEIRYAEALPNGQRNEGTIASLKRRLARLGT